MVSAVSVACEQSPGARATDTGSALKEERARTGPVRDSADAVARILAAPDINGTRGTKRVTSVTRDTAGYWVTLDVEGPYVSAKGVRMLIRPTGEIFDIVDSVR